MLLTYVYIVHGTDPEDTIFKEFVAPPPPSPLATFVGCFSQVPGSYETTFLLLVSCTTWAVILTT